MGNLFAMINGAAAVLYVLFLYVADRREILLCWGVHGGL